MRAASGEVFCLHFRRNRIAALVFPTSRAARLSGTKSNSRGSLIFWAKCFAVSAKSNLSWAKSESLMHADMYRVAFSFFRIGLVLPSITNLSCNFFRGVLTVLVFALHPDSLMMRCAWLKSSSFNVQELSSLICPDPKYSSRTEICSHPNLHFQEFPRLWLCILILRSVSM